MISGRINPLKTKARKRWRGETNPSRQRGRVVLPLASRRFRPRALVKRTANSAGTRASSSERHSRPVGPPPRRNRPLCAQSGSAVEAPSGASQLPLRPAVRRRRRNAMGGLPAGVWHPLPRLGAVTRVHVAKGPCCFTRYGAQKSSGGLFGQIGVTGRREPSTAAARSKGASGSTP